jgi:hypothetical protein
VIGILNDQQKPNSTSHDVPHPGTFLVDRKGVVTARFFEDAYERFTAATILAPQDVDPDRTALTAQTNHLAISASVTYASVAPGERIVLFSSSGRRRILDTRLRARKTRQSSDPAGRRCPTLAPHARNDLSGIEIYYFEPLDERGVYSNRLPGARPRFWRRRDHQDAWSMPTVTITGALEYQACDDKL